MSEHVRAQETEDEVCAAVSLLLTVTNVEPH